MHGRRRTRPVLFSSILTCFSAFSAKKFEDLLQMKTLPYLYLSRRDFDAVAKELCASCYVEDMKDTFANHPAFPTLPKSFLGRFCAFLVMRNVMPVTSTLFNAYNS